MTFHLSVWVSPQKEWGGVSFSCPGGESIQVSAIPLCVLVLGRKLPFFFLHCLVTTPSLTKSFLGFSLRT